MTQETHGTQKTQETHMTQETHETQETQHYQLIFYRLGYVYTMQLAAV